MGKKQVLGIDEVGRGALAGPLVVGGVVFPPNTVLRRVTDSKQVSPQERARLAVEIRKKALFWTVVSIPPSDIDTEGVTRVMQRAVRTIIAACKDAEAILLDGRPLFSHAEDMYAVVAGDVKIKTIAAASILAKVHRDTYMEELHTTHPSYQFARNKGYGTAQHCAIIKARGICTAHRRLFVRNLLRTQCSIFDTRG